MYRPVTLTIAINNNNKINKNKTKSLPSVRSRKGFNAIHSFASCFFHLHFRSQLSSTCSNSFHTSCAHETDNLFTSCFSLLSCVHTCRSRATASICPFNGSGRVRHGPLQITYNTGIKHSQFSCTRGQVSQ